jgi:hypothetical protein
MNGNEYEKTKADAMKLFEQEMVK